MSVTGRKNLIASVLLALASILVALFAVEVTLRVLEPTSNVEVLRESRTNHGTYLALRPGAHGLMLGRTVTVNEEAYPFSGTRRARGHDRSSRCRAWTWR